MADRVAVVLRAALTSLRRIFGAPAGNPLPCERELRALVSFGEGEISVEATVRVQASPIHGERVFLWLRYRARGDSVKVRLTPDEAVLLGRWLVERARLIEGASNGA